MVRLVHKNIDCHFLPRKQLDYWFLYIITPYTSLNHHDYFEYSKVHNFLINQSLHINSVMTFKKVIIKNSY